jgi:hypothetical protein
MDVKGVKFAGAVFDDPVLDGTLLRDQVGRRVHIERLGGGAVDAEVELHRARRVIRIVQLFRKIEVPDTDRWDVTEPRL